MDFTRKTLKLKLKLFLTTAFLCFFWGSAAELKAQNAVQQTPDCVRFFSFSATGAGAPLANYGTGSPDGPQACTTWILVYATFGTVTGVSLRVESAPAATISTPGTFGAYAGTVSSGINPNTSTSGAQTFLSNGIIPIPWIRVALNTFTGSGTRGVFGMLEGWNQGNGGGGTTTPCAGTIAAPCIVAGPDASGAPSTQSPVQVAGNDGTNIRTLRTDSTGRTQLAGTSTAQADGISNTQQALNVNSVAGVVQDFPYVFNSATWDRQFNCTNRQAFTLSAGTDVVVATGVAARQIRLCHLDFASDTSAVMTIRQGTGSTCLSTTVALSGAYQNIVTFAADYAPTSPLSTSVAANDVCLHFSASVTAGGVAIYAQY